MIKIRMAILAIVAVSLRAHQPLQAQSNQPEAKASAEQKSAKPIDAYAWLIGGVWTADASKLAPGMLRIETQYSRSDNNSYIRFTTHFVSEHGTLKNYDGSMYWDATKNELRMWYMDASDHITECPMTITGDRWQMEFPGTDFDDKPADLRVLVDRKSPDLYHWSLSEKSGESWKPLLDLDYARK